MDMFIMMCIVLNTICMAMDHHKMDGAFLSFLDYSNKFFTAIFTCEMLVKVIALDPFFYFQERWNIFDAFIVLLSFIEIAVSKINGLSVFRSLRLLRVFKLAKSWPTMKSLMKIIGNTIGALGNLTVILVVIVFIFAIVGMQLFKEIYNDEHVKAILPEKVPLRWHTKNFWHSFLIVFRILCGEWIENMWICMKLSENDYICIIFFLVVLVFGNLVVLNLFLALLLSSFSADLFQTDDDKEMTNLKMAMKQVRSGFSHAGASVSDVVWHIIYGRPSLPSENGLDMEDVKAPACRPTDGLAQQDVKTLANMQCMTNGMGVMQLALGGRPSLMNVPIAQPENDSLDDEEKMPPEQISNTHYITVAIDAPKPDCDLLEGVTATSMCRCVPDVGRMSSHVWITFRKTCYVVVEHQCFETFIIFMILLSSGVLACEDVYIEKRKVLKTILVKADIFFTYIFLLEMLLKLIAYGFHKYFKSFWCCLDLFIVVISVTSLVAHWLGIDKLSAIKNLRTLRAIRPLRALSRFEGMRVVVNALVGAIPSIANVLLVCLIFWLVFSIVGVNSFKGRFHKCVDEAFVPLNSSIIKNRTQCIQHGGYEWINAPVHFDNVLYGYLALLQVATFKGWMEIMYDAVDATTVEEQPEFEKDVYYYAYFVFFIVFGTFFILNLFIGVIIDNFNQQKKKFGGEDIFLTEEQKKYHHALKKLGNKKPVKPIPPPKNKLQRLIFHLVSNQKFEITIMVLIFLNMLTMVVETDPQAKTKEDVLYYFNMTFIGIFTMECLLKLIGQRQYFFTLSWNIFDLVIVVISIFDLAMEKTLELFTLEPTIFRVIRLFRIGRILRLFRGAQGIRTLLFALLMSLPALFNIGLLLFLIMYIFSIFGMSQFSLLKHRHGIDDMFNFETFCGSMLCLFQITTSAGWDKLLLPTLDKNCDENKHHAGVTTYVGDCGKPAIGIAYFVSYIIISFLVVVNMYIAIILENFNVAKEESKEPLSEDDFELFFETWGKFDPQATNLISYSKLPDFLDKLEPPLRVPKPNQLFIGAKDLPMDAQDCIHCLDIICTLTQNVLGDSANNNELRQEMEKRFAGEDEQSMARQIVTSTFQRQKYDKAAIIIQKAVRKRQLVAKLVALAKKPNIANDPSKLMLLCQSQGINIIATAASPSGSEGDGAAISSPCSRDDIPPTTQSGTGIQKKQADILLSNVEHCQTDISLSDSKNGSLEELQHNRTTPLSSKLENGETASSLSGITEEGRKTTSSTGSEDHTIISLSRESMDSSTVTSPSDSEDSTIPSSSGLEDNTITSLSSESSDSSIVNSPSGSSDNSTVSL
uniref:sodium channel protein type 8 subunit alpha-like n=1 Tax=Myxine glutinosa TaxID=7769 RepID=UPI0035901B20